MRGFKVKKERVKPSSMVGGAAIILNYYANMLIQLVQSEIRDLNMPYIELRFCT
jgi:hypothetical protein